VKNQRRTEQTDTKSCELRENEKAAIMGQPITRKGGVRHQVGIDLVGV
jgi:hypothetical protein